jgi:hypothetical protein
MAATTLIDGLIGKPDDEASTRTIMSKKGEARRIKYAVWVKSNLNNVLTDLKDWREIFDISWFLIIRQSDKAIDHELKPVEASDDKSLSALKELRKAIRSTINSQPEAEKTTVFLSSALFEEPSTKLEYSSVEFWHNTNGANSYIADPPSDTSTIVNVCNLAKILKNVEPVQFGILRCHGVLKLSPSTTDAKDPCSTRFIFSVPAPLTKPQSLRKLVLAGIETRPLDERYLLARQLAKAVMFMHSAGFVHKNIRPETVLVLRDERQDPHAFLTGFQSFRLDEGRTLLRGDTLWEKNLYRHPTRQGMLPEESYSMQHDIYSLGVCLLEIGIAESMVLYDSTGLPTASSLISSMSDALIKDTRKRAFEMKRTFVRIAEDRLPAKMGRKYTEIVVTCLTCLDKSDNSFGLEAEFLDENGLLVGVRFIEKVRAETYA